MNEEEKKAVEKIKEIIECFYCFPNPTNIELKDCDCSTLEIVLNLIEKLQKENEKLKADNYELNNRKYSNSKDKIEIEEDVKLLKSYLEAMQDVPLGR